MTIIAVTFARFKRSQDSDWESGLMLETSENKSVLVDSNLKNVPASVADHDENPWRGRTLFNLDYTP